MASNWLWFDHRNEPVQVKPGGAWQSPLLHCPAKMSAQRGRFVPCWAQFCHEQGRLRACMCHVFLEIPVLPSFWWCTCLLSLKSPPFGVMSASSTVSGHWVKACLACAKLSSVTDSVNVSRKLFPVWGRWLWFRQVWGCFSESYSSSFFGGRRGAVLRDLWDLTSPTRDGTWALWSEHTESNHWTAKKFPWKLFLWSGTKGLCPPGHTSHLLLGGRIDSLL